MKKLFMVMLTLFVVSAFTATAPDFTITDLNGNTHKLTDYTNNGKFVLVALAMGEN